jgi:hypothetical protein
MIILQQKVIPVMSMEIFAIIKDYSRHIRYVDKSDCMTDTLHQQTDLKVEKETYFTS